MQQLEDNFDDFANQSLAYRQSLAAIRYISEVHGENSLKLIINELKKGITLITAVEKVLKMNYSEFGEAWTKWARVYMNNIN